MMKSLFLPRAFTTSVFFRLTSAPLLALAWVALNTASAPGSIAIAGYWRMGDGDPGATAGMAATNLIDATGAHNLAINGPASYSTDVSADAWNHRSSLLSVNFTNGAYATSAIVTNYVDNFGIECWVKPTAQLGTGQVIVYNGRTDTTGWGLIITPTNAPTPNAYQLLYGGKVALGTNTAVPNTWTHLALVRDSGLTTLYVNGVATVTSGAIPAIPNTGFAIGAPPQSVASQNLNGLVDEVRVFTFTGGQFSTNDLLLKLPNYTVGANSRLEGPGSGLDNVALNVYPSSATWNALTNVPWLHLSASSGAGTTNLAFTYDANTGPTRTGMIYVASQTISIYQAGSNYVAAQPLTTLAYGYNYTEGLRVDGAGNVYFTANANNSLYEWVAATATVTNLIPSGLVEPNDVALDNAGNLYIADYGTGTIKERVATNATLVTLVFGLEYPQGVSVDGAQNVYFTDSGRGLIKERLAVDGTILTLPVGSLTQSSSSLVDFARNVYFTDFTGSGFASEYLAASSNVVGVMGNLSYPAGCAVDGNGDVYVADTFHFALKKRAAADGSVTQLLGAGTEVAGVTLDGNRNIYYTLSNNGSVIEWPYSFVVPAPITEPVTAGTDSLPPVLPTTENLTGPFTPVSDQPWLTITGVTNGVVSFAFTSTTAGRQAHITLMGQTITVTQGVVVTTPPTLTNLQLMGSGVVQFAFTNVAGATFEILSTTNLGLPLSQWKMEGAPSVTGPGQYQFTSGADTTNKSRFFIVRSP